MTQPVSAAVIRDLLDKVDTRNGRGGVLGIRGPVVWTGPEITHAGHVVEVVACGSSLAVREALRSRQTDRWLVVITDRNEDDLGLGITAHFTGRRLRQADPWDAVRRGFDATRIDHFLANAEGRRDLATALLNTAPDNGWPPARGGLLTYDHALGSVVAAHLGLGAADNVLDLAAVLWWSVLPNATRRATDLSALAGPRFGERVADWIASRCGVLREPVAALMRAGRVGDLLPLGLVARVIDAAPDDSGPRALFRHQFDGVASTLPLQPWAEAAEGVARRLLDQGDPTAVALVLGRADALLGAVEATTYAESSPILRSGLNQRLDALGDALHRSVERATTRVSAAGVDATLADPGTLDLVESSWARVGEHALAKPSERRIAGARAGVRLVRWLSQAVVPAEGLSGEIHRHWTADSWVDQAVADAWSGVEDEQLARGLRSVLAATRLRRAAHDLSFAAAIVAHESAGAPAPSGSYNVENLLRATVMPLAKQAPVLFVLADGMSCSVASEIVVDINTRFETWLECLPESSMTRLSAVAAYPTLTKVSRTSLFCGELSVGEQNAEREGFTKLCSSAGVSGKLFHKLALDTSEAGFALAHDVANAVDDTRVDVVACVLNTIDDALDRSDPGGTEWTADSVKHLNPLLDRARRAGRIVVLASDHGHIVERRTGHTVSASDVSSNRSRAAHGMPAGDGEVRMTGPRVLEHDGDAILAVDENIRYGPLKAGYHGGAAPAEAIIPVCVLVTGEPPPGWKLAPPQAPTWWRTSTAGVIDEPPVELPARRIRRVSVDDNQPTLFTPEPVVDIVFSNGPDLVGAVAGSHSVAAAVLSSATYKAQRRRLSKTSVTDEAIARLLSAAARAVGNRLDPDSAAAALGIATVQLAGALPQVQRLLNVEQYPVIARDADGITIVVDMALLREQFEITG